MSEPKENSKPLFANFEAWEERAITDKQTYHERQASEVFLAALGSTPKFGKKIFLKGGVLVGAVYESGRNTADLDFSTTIEPSMEFLAELELELEAALPAAAAQLGSPGTIIRIQSVRYRPRKDSFVEADAPGIEVKFAFAERGSDQEKRLLESRSNQILYADISFNEKIESIDKISIGQTGLSFFAYSKVDLIAEKLRSVLQQKTRNRNRRQDIYDINFLIGNYPPSQAERNEILQVFKIKCESRSIDPNINSFNDAEVRSRSEKDWETLRSEVDHLPDFDEAYDTVLDFYRGLWIETN